MSRRALLAWVAFLGLSVSLSAQEIRTPGAVAPDGFTLNQFGPGSTVDPGAVLSVTDLFRTLHGVYYGPEALRFADGGLFTFPSAFAWMEAGPAPVLPAVALEQPPRANPIPSRVQGSGDNKAIDLLPKLDYAGGEVGFLFGKSTGKFSREVEAGYIFGEIADGNTHISVGASYEHSSGRVPYIFGR